MSWICCPCESCIRSIKLAICSPSVASFLMASPIVSSSLSLHASRPLLTLYFFSFASSCHWTTSGCRGGATSRTGTARRFSSTCFWTICRASTVFCSLRASLLHVVTRDDITAAKDRINYVVMRTFAQISPTLPTIPVLLFFVLVLQMLNFALALVEKICEPKGANNPSPYCE